MIVGKDPLFKYLACYENQQGAHEQLNSKRKEK